MKDKLILNDFFSYEDKESILAQMQAHSKEWGAIPFLLSLLKEGSFHQKLHQTKKAFTKNTAKVSPAT